MTVLGQAYRDLGQLALRASDIERIDEFEDVHANLRLLGVVVTVPHLKEHARLVASRCNQSR